MWLADRSCRTSRQSRSICPTGNLRLVVKLEAVGGESDVAPSVRAALLLGLLVPEVLAAHCTQLLVRFVAIACRSHQKVTHSFQTNSQRQAGHDLRDRVRQRINGISGQVNRHRKRKRACQSVERHTYTGTWSCRSSCRIETLRASTAQTHSQRNDCTLCSAVRNL